MTEPMIVLHVDTGDGWRPAGVLARDAEPQVGSLSSDDIVGGRRDVYLFGWYDGQVGVWRSTRGADVEVDTLRIVTSDGLERLADLEDGPHTITVARPRLGDVRIEFALWRTPMCPGCEQPPAVVLPGGAQVFCGNNDCHVLAWDPGSTLEDIQRNAASTPGLGEPS